VNLPIRTAGILVVLLGSALFAEVPADTERSILLRTLQDRDIAHQERPLYTGYGSFGSSVHVVLPGTTPRRLQNETFILAIPLLQSEGNAPILSFGSQTALEFIRHFTDRPAPLEILVVFLEYETHLLPFTEPALSHAGLRDAVSRYDDPEKLTILYLDLPTAAQGLTIHHGAGSSIAPLRVLRPLPDLLTRQGIPFDLAVHYNELYRLGLIRGPEALGIIQTLGGKGLYLDAGRNPLKNGAMSSTSADLATVLASYVEGLAQSTLERDYHYSVLVVGTKSFFIPETGTVILFLALTALVLAGILIHSLVHRKMLLIQWRVFIKRSWVLPVYLALLYTSLWSAGVLFSLLLRFFGVQAATATYGGAVLKVFMALAAYALLYPLASRLRIPRRAHFYGHAAVIFVAAGLLVAASLDATFIPVFLWAFFFSWLAALLPSPGGVFICAVLAPLQIVAALSNAVGSGDNSVALLIMSSAPLSTLYLTFMLMPFMMLFKRASLLASGRRPRTSRMRHWLPRILLMVGSVAASLSYAYQRSERPADPARGKPLEIQSTLIPGLTVQERAFLDRRILTVTLSADQAPLRYDLTLSSADTDRTLVVYDAPVPYLLTPDGGGARFLLGEHPVNPLTAELVVPLDFRGTLEAAAVYQAGTLAPYAQAVRFVRSVALP